MSNSYNKREIIRGLEEKHTHSLSIRNRFPPCSNKLFQDLQTKVLPNEACEADNNDSIPGAYIGLRKSGFLQNFGYALP